MEENAWSVIGVLQKTNRYNVRSEMSSVEAWGEGIDSVKMFRVGEAAERKENLESPIKCVSAPTLMEVKQLPDSYLDDVRHMRSQLQYLLNSRLIVDSAECVNRLGQLATKILVEYLGKKLQHVSDDVKKMLIGGNGPFSGRKRSKKRTCGTYFELMRFHLHPKFVEYLCYVEESVIKKFSHIQGFPQQPESLRKMFLDFVDKGRVLRDAQSYIGLLTQVEKEAALQQIEDNLNVLEKCGFDLVTPLVSAGIHILRHGISYQVEDDLNDEAELEEGSHSISSKGDEFIERKQTSVKVTFAVKKKLQLGYAVSIFGYHSLLGKGLPDHAIQMSCADGYTWSKVFKFAEGENIQYSFVIVKKQKASKWVMVDGPLGEFTVHVGASAMTVETNLEGEHGDGENEPSSSSD
ncbi:hypothetical protein L7F22_012743 [Adiantum nelumboides]|nr:hypothetical protein [Adiantum nelumboides]